MQLIRQARDFQSAGRKACLAIGMFDGVHLGHQQVLRQTIQDAAQHHGISVAVTFDRHPNSVVAPERAPLLLYSLPQKLRALETLGIDAVLLLEFTPELSQVPGEVFIRNLVRDFSQVYSICVGSTFTFGYKRSGNVDLLRKVGAELNFHVHGLAAVSLDEVRVSSTRIRETIRAGDLDSASQMLGRPYSVSATVVRGDQLGQKIGFPTANLDCTGLLVPPHGVYAVYAKVRDQLHPAVVNIGVRPTLQNPNPPLRVEVHLINFAGDLYGQEMEIAFVAHLRPEQRFESLDNLKVQIARDIKSAQQHFL